MDKYLLWEKRKFEQKNVWKLSCVRVVQKTQKYYLNDQQQLILTGLLGPFLSSRLQSP
jgi:hypothetical protein